jgi:two-component system chemotaxis response regulator CheY
MDKPNILLVDSDDGFGFMLKEGLQNTGRYSAVWAHTGGDALQAVIEKHFDLVIIDSALSDMKPATLVKAIRDAKHGMKIMLIPLMGDELPENLRNLEVNGILPKPFFVGDLPDLVDKAMGRTGQRTANPPPLAAELPEVSSVESTSAMPLPIDEEPPALPNLNLEMAIPVVPQETIRFLRASETEILRLLGDLNREVRAEAILVVAGINLIAHSGMLDRGHCEELAVLVAQSTQAAAQAAGFLGERAGRFSQSLHEGGAYRLYTLTLAEGILLSLALSTNVPLGMIRHQCRQISEQLSKYII